MTDAIENEMFGGETEQSAMQVITELAEHIVMEEAACSLAKSELTERTDKMKAAKVNLYDLMQEAGFQNIKLDSGLTPSRSLTTKYYKAAGVDNEDLFDWLRLDEVGLGDIIKPTVHHGTLNSALKAFVEQGGQASPNLINAVPEKGIRMNGKSKFLASKALTATAAE